MNALARKFAVLLLLGYILFGTVAADWLMQGHTTKGYGLWLLAGGIIIALLFATGIMVARKHQTFLNFRLWQWTSLTTLTLGAGIAVRVFMF